MRTDITPAKPRRRYQVVGDSASRIFELDDVTWSSKNGHWAMVNHDGVPTEAALLRTIPPSWSDGPPEGGERDNRDQ